MGHHKLASGHHQVPSVKKPIPRATPQQAAGCFTAPPPLLSLLGADIGHKKNTLAGAGLLRAGHGGKESPKGVCGGAKAKS